MSFSDIRDKLKDIDLHFNVLLLWTVVLAGVLIFYGRTLLSIDYSNGDDSIPYILLGVLCGVYVIVWYMKGRDPKKPTVIPQYDNPLKSINPSLAGHLVGRYSRRTPSVMISLIMKGAVKLNVINENEREYTRTNKFISMLDEIERFALEQYFQDFDTLNSNEFHHREAMRKAFRATDNLIIDKAKKAFPFIVNENTGAIFVMVNLGLAVTCMFLDIRMETFFVVSAMGLLAMFVFLYFLGKESQQSVESKALVEGYKLYLATALHDAKELERLLPYAVAFNLENEWLHKFGLYAKEAKYNPEWCKLPKGYEMDFDTFKRIINKVVANICS